MANWTSCFGLVAYNAFGVACSLPSVPDYMPCFDDPHMNDYDVRSVKVADVDRDGKQELVARVRYLSYPVTDALKDKVRARCKGRDYLPTSKFLPAAKSYTLVFDYDGKQFVPNAATRKLLEKWKLAGPERWYSNAATCRGA